MIIFHISYLYKSYELTCYLLKNNLYIYIEKIFDDNFNIFRKKKKKELEFSRIDSNCTNFHDYIEDSMFRVHLDIADFVEN